jgi:hypothetical protein
MIPLYNGYHGLDLDNLTPMRAMEVLYKLKEKSRKALRDGR